MTESEKKTLNNNYFKRCLAVFCVIAASILFTFILLKFSTILSGIRRFIAILSPMIYGIIIAYLSNPFLKLLDKLLKNRIVSKSKEKNKHKVEKIFNYIDVILSVLIFLVIIAAVLFLIIPSFIACVSDLIDTVPDQFGAWLKGLIVKLNNNKAVAGFLSNVYTSLEDWYSDLGPKLTTAITNFNWTGTVASGASVVASAVGSIINVVKNIVIGAMFALFLLFAKKTYIKKFKRLCYVLFKKETANGFLNFCKKTYSVFDGFIIGKLLDSAIIGVLAYFGCLIFNFPYRSLVAIIVGVTNIIPIFGPYIGAIPCIILIFLNTPIKALYFIIFILCLQTLDGYVIGPKILGDKTGLDTIWVIFAITVGGGLFGVAGMFLGVPAFAVLYYFANQWIEHLAAKRLTKKENKEEDQI